MAELTTIGYRPGNSLLHRFDTRFKIAVFILASVGCVDLHFFTLTIFSALLSFLILHCRMPLRSLFNELRYFCFFLGIIFLVRSVSADAAAFVQISFLKISAEGIRTGALICWRLLLIVLMGMLFVYSTPASQIKAAVGWFLNPLPAVPGKRIATMLGLIVRFIPEIIHQFQETGEAQRARCVELRKNPLVRIKLLGVPFMRRTFENADKVIVAMEARCYCDARTDPELLSSTKDRLALLLCLVFLAVLLVVDKLS